MRLAFTMPFLLMMPDDSSNPTLYRAYLEHLTRVTQAHRLGWFSACTPERIETGGWWPGRRLCGGTRRCPRSEGAMAFSMRKALIGLSLWTVVVAGAAQAAEVYQGDDYSYGKDA